MPELMAELLFCIKKYFAGQITHPFITGIMSEFCPTIRDQLSTIRVKKFINQLVHFFLENTIIVNTQLLHDTGHDIKGV